MTTHSQACFDLGPWANGNFQATVSQHRGVGANSDTPDDVRFVSGVVRLLRKQTSELEAQGESKKRGVAIFILKSGPPNSQPDAKREPMFDNGLTSVAGQLWFSAPAVVSAYRVELPQDAGDDELFNFVIDDLKVGSEPALFFEGRTAKPQLRWYPKGLQETDEVEVKCLEGDITPETISDTINRLYNESLKTPDGLPKVGNLWENSSKCWPSKHAESLVQIHLKNSLLSKFPFCTVRHEQPHSAGRTDLEIEQSDPLDPSSINRIAILELKILRSYGSTGNPITKKEIRNQIEEGVRQAYTYRKEKPTRWSALCCFDMRKIDCGRKACFAHVLASATNMEVKLWRWFLFSSAASYRQSVSHI